MKSLVDILAEAGVLRASGRPADALRCVQDWLRITPLRANDHELCGRFVIDTLRAGPEAGSLPAVSVAVLGNYTTSNIAHAVRTMLLLEGFLADVYEAEYGVYRQEILDPASRLYERPRDLVLLASGTRGMPELVEALNAPGRGTDAMSHMEQDFRLCWETLHERLKCPIVQHTFEPPALSWVGPGERDLDDAPDRMVADFNHRLRSAAPSFVYWLDVAGLAAQVGHRNWTDLRLYYHGKFGISPRAITAYAHAFLGLFRALWGRSRKCLVVDLDNTLWGGVVGDDGLDGILLGPDTPAGEAHRAFCEYLLGLKRRGILLAVCSKNDESSAREVFEKHPHMPLRLSDISAIRCNWDDKPGNIEAIARELNIDLSHIAFFDDNPAECEFVRSSLPQVYVLQAPEDPAMLVWTVDDAHLFDMVKISAEDLLRASSYAGRQAAENMRAQSEGVEDYLERLDMKAVCSPATPADAGRLAQMEKKTNQFNLTTRRYDESFIRSLMSREDVTVLACRLIDRFADHGLVASMILIREGDSMRIDSWLMSCRVFARTLEHFMMRKALGVASDAGVHRIVGAYIPTEKNHVVKPLFSSLGFTPDKESAGLVAWSREVGLPTSDVLTYVADAEAPPAEGA